MATGIDLRAFFQNIYSVNDQGLENIFDLINASIALAAKEKPKEFLARRSQIIQSLLMLSPMDDIDQDCSISSSSNFSCESLLDEDLDDQFDGVMSAPSIPIYLGAEEKCFGIIQSMAFDGENKDRGKMFQRKIETEGSKHKIDARRGNEGLSLDEVKFEEPSLDVKKVKKKVKIVAKENGSRINRSAAFDEENKDRGKMFQKKIETEGSKHKIHARSGNEGLSLDKVKSEGQSLDVKKVEKKVQIGAEQKGSGIIQSVAFDGENKDGGKKFQRQIETGDAKHKIEARRGNKGLGLDEVKFEATKRKFEEASLDIKKAKRKVQILDLKDIPQSKPTVVENRFKRGGFEKPSFRRK